MTNILCFGDSNTFGYNPANGGRFGWGTRWTSLLAEKLGSEYHITEEGLCGRTTCYEDRLRQGRNGSRALPMLLESHTPDVVIIMLGTNDCKTFYGASAEEIAEGARVLVRQVRSFSRDAGVLLVSPIRLAEGVGEAGFDPEFNSRSVEVSLRLPEAFRAVAHREGCGFLAASDYAEPSLLDREHMDADSHSRLSEALFHAITAL